MIKVKLFIPFVLFLSVLLFAGCSKDDDGFNPAEADILSATIENADEILQTEPTITNDEVVFKLKDTLSSYILAPEYEITHGATMEPESGTELDFSTLKEYKVTSANGEWDKTYEVKFIIDDEEDYKYSFEHVKTIDVDNPTAHYHEFYTDEDLLKKEWDSGNIGFHITMDQDEENTPDFFPTMQIEDGYNGKGVKLETKKTGELGATVGSPLAAGNLFLGNFELSFPPIESTRFGEGQRYKSFSAPVALKGHYKYKRGEDFEINNEEFSNIEEDKWNAYAILFEKTDEENFLRGDHNFEDPRNVAVAQLADEDRVEADEWTEFYIPFEFEDGKEFKLDEEYMITIVFTSSIEGDLFNGAEGSTLYIDEVELVTEQDEEDNQPE